MLYRAVLPGGIHRLKNKKHRPAVLCIKNVLKVGEHVDTRGQSFFSSGFVVRLEVLSVIGINILQLEIASVCNSVWFREPNRSFDEFLGFHILGWRSGCYCQPPPSAL